MTSRNRSTIQMGVVAVVMIASLLLGIFVYYNSLLDNLQESNCVTLQEVLVQEENSFTRILRSGRSALMGFSMVVDEKRDDAQGLQRLLEMFAINTDFEYVCLAKPDGTAVNNKGERTDVADRYYFKDALSGQTIISDPIKPKGSGTYVVEVATPVMRGDEISGIIIGGFATEKFEELFTGSFDGYGYTYVATNSGELIVRADNANAMARTENLFDLFEESDFYMGESYETMRQNLVEGNGGHTQYSLNGQRRMMHYGKLPINNWNIFVVVNPQSIQKTANVILRNAILLTAALMLMFFAMLAYVFLSQRRFNRELTRMAYVDAVTGKRSLGKFNLDAEALVRKYPDVDYMLVKLDIQNFRLINDMCTPETGDQVLVALAEALELTLDDERDAFARVHADEFVALVSFNSDGEFEEKQRMFDISFAENVGELIDFALTIPRGRCRMERDTADFSQCFENANFAHRLAKIGADKDIEFDDTVKQLAVRRQSIENQMESALWNDEFKMYLQPKFRLADERMIGAEALVRWIRDDGSMLPPNEFIFIFEENGFITQLDMYMFRCACAKLSEWIGCGIEPFPISVNFSRVHLCDSNFVQELAQIADEYKTPHELLEIELTETVMFDNIELLSQVIGELHKAGFTLSMDDFGTGYSSLGLLKNIPVDVIKMDKNFFGISDDMERAATVIASVVEMAHQLGIHTIAEGVESKDQVDLLRNIGCEFVQGYYYAMPTPADELDVLLARKQPSH